MAKVTFNGVNREIIILPAIEEIDVQIDLYSDWKEWVLLSDNSKYPAAFRTFGGDPTITGQFAPRYFFLINNWEISASSISVNIATNLYSDAEGSGILIDNAAVLVRNSDAAVVDAGIAQSLDYNGVVYINTRTGQDGFVWPYGTVAQPVNNLTNAILVAAQFNINNYNVRGDLDFDIDVTNSVFNAGEHLPRITFLDADVSGSQFNNFGITGTMSMPDPNEVEFRDCAIYKLYGMNGDILNSRISGKITISPEHAERHLLMVDCVSSIFDPSDTDYVLLNPHPEIVCIDAATISTINTIVIKNYSGGMDLLGSNFGTGSRFAIEVDPGLVRIHSSVSGGKISVRGIGTLYNNLPEDSPVELDLSGFLYDIELNTHLNAYSGYITVNTVMGVSGSVYPVGTNLYPVNNVADAFLLSDRYGIHHFHLHSGVTFSNVDLSGYTIHTSKFPPKVFIDMCTASRTNFFQVEISGTFSGPDLLNPVLIENSVVGNLDNFNGIIYNSAFTGELTIPPNASILLTDCKSAVPGLGSPVISKYLGHTASVLLSNRAYSGGLRLKDWNNPGDVTTLEYIAGRANIDATCTEGTIVIRGVGKLNNETGTASNVTIITDGFTSDLHDSLERVEPEVFRIGVVVDNLTGSTSSEVYDLLQSVAGTVSLIYTDTTELVTDVNYLVTQIDLHSDILNKIAGLVQSNFRIYDQVFDVDGLLQSATIRTYPTATDTNNNTNADYEYSMSATYDGSGRLIDYRVVDV